MSVSDEYARPPDCKCGHGKREHKNGKRVTSCERLSCGCQEYRPTSKPVILRHADHDPNLICRPAGYGLCEPLEVPGDRQP